jgi:hypothetical protein
MRSTPTACLEALLNIVPIDIYIQTSALKTMLRLMLRNQWLAWYGRGSQGPVSHMDFCLKLSEQINDLPAALDNSLAAAKTSIDSWGKNLHQLRWDTMTSCRTSKLFLKGPYELNRGLVINMSRHDLHHLVQIISGHNTLNYHMNMIGMTPSSICRCGEEDEDSFHFMATCGIHALLRMTTLGFARLYVEELRELPFSDLASFIALSRRFRTSLVGSGLPPSTSAQ